MNTDFIVWDEPIREKKYLQNITSGGDTRYYSDSCKTIKKYAKEQNTIYNPLTNQMLYGINSAMKVSGVSDGTCNQINPYIFAPANICGAGAAGGNRCVGDAYPQAYEIDPKFYANINKNMDMNMNAKTFGLENFDSNDNKYNCDYCNVTQFIITVLLVILLIGVIYAKYSNEKI
jgi:hypothetical protein